MAKQMKQKSKAKKSIKKSFYEVSASMVSMPIHLYGSSPEALEGRVVKLDLTKNLRGKSFELKLKVKLNGEKLQGEAVSIELAISYIRRVMRNGTDYCEDSFEVPCRDAMVVIKPLLISRKRVSRAVLGALRVTARKHLESYVKTRNVQELFSEIMANKLQKQLSLRLKKIYPLALCEIRTFKISGNLDEKEE